MSEIPEEFSYTKNHLWVDFVDGVSTIGLTDFYQNEFGDILLVEINNQDPEINFGDFFCIIESNQETFEIHSPLSGKLVDVNKDIIVEPHHINTSPYEAGWLFKLQIDDKSELDNLLTDDEYYALTE